MLNNWNIRFWEYDFFSPHWLWLMCGLPLFIILPYLLEKNRKGEVKYSRSTSDQKNIGSRWIFSVRQGLILVNASIVALLIFAIAKPFNWNNYDASNKNYKDGIDIILAMDVSLSMLAMDFTPNRLEASKQVAKDFIDGRNGDRIEGGTAIGTGLGTAVSRLRNDSIASKVIILLTDGSNNSGEISPIMAAELARAKNIRVYTIGVGSTGLAPSPVITPFGVQYQNMPVEIDEMTLMKIADIANGQYFRATDEKSLKAIYQEIEKLEKRKMEDQHFKSNPPANPQAFLNWAFVLAIISWGTKYLLFRQND